MHPEALGEKEKELFGKLPAFEGFYLAGGTALALQIGHRVSVDFDLFSNEEIPAPLFDEAQKIFKDRTFTPSGNSRDELTVFIDGTKVTFLRYPFPVLDAFTVYGGLKLLSVKEIATTKAYTIGRRGSFKDYVDLYYVLTEGHASLREITGMAQEKYRELFNPRLFFEQLLYLDDITDTAIMFIKPEVSKESLRVFFEEQIKNFGL